MEMLENVIRLPIFFQSAVFVLQFSIFLYEIEVVRNNKDSKINQINLKLLFRVHFGCKGLITKIVIPSRI